MNEHLNVWLENYPRIFEFEPVFFFTQFIINAVTIYLRGVQTQNVIHGNYLGATITSSGMAIASVGSIGLIAADPWSSAIPVLLGGVVGVNSAMYYKRKGIPFITTKKG